MSDRETRVLDWRRLLPAAGKTTLRLRQLLLGGALASAGLTVAPETAQATVPHESLLLPTPLLTERGKRTARLVLAIPGIARNLVGQHRSHSSHSSHRSHSSHYSGSGGGSSSGTVMPIAPTTPAPKPETATSASANALTAALLEASSVVGVIEKIDKAKRMLSVRATDGLREFAFRDDTQFEIVAGVAVRLDEYLEAHPHSFPVAEKERVSIKWRRSTTTQGLVAMQVSPAKPQP